ncbi:MAG: 8-oxo-dGTP diphosphatase [Patescibacteria group bacterium]|nr:8-oxo-dGTP diphosphatase [Patescibacteria group bacterium]MDD5490517.1 8-oxo-dGTP diphosphatase [Patescibacteria group bacterium]
MAKKILTLSIIYKNNKILLGMKKRGFGEGRWNGFGGKVEDKEDIKEAARRELREEAGIFAKELEEVGIINFEFKNNPEILEVHFFKADNFEGEPLETEEMKPRWFRVKEIPFEEMWPDDKYWIPLFLDNKRFKGKFLFRDMDKIVDFSLKEVTVL